MATEIDRKRNNGTGETLGIRSYLARIQKYPLLTAEEELSLTRQYVESKDRSASRRIVNSHLKLVSKIAFGYRGYGLPLQDLISEGTIGVIKALERFDPEKGFRFSTYATWWIKASIKDYVLKSWSMVKMGTTSDQKKLFFSLRKLKNQLEEREMGDTLSEKSLTLISEKLKVSKESVKDMNQRLSGPDYSLNAPLKDAEGGSWQDWLEDDRENQELILMNSDDLDKKRELLKSAMDSLSAREQHILMCRKLSDNPPTLSDIADEMDLSRERIRQIEQKAFEKLQRSVKQKALEKRMSPRYNEIN
ncbi:MAG: RNA polymerase factor sigma-32 [Alphaproteobacteria bacterium]